MGVRCGGCLRDIGDGRRADGGRCGEGEEGSGDVVRVRVKRGFLCVKGSTTNDVTGVPG